MRKSIIDPSVGSSAEEGFWPSDARTVQALLCTALLTALFFSWLWQAFRLYSYPGLVPYNDEAGELFHLPLFTGLALLATPPAAVPFCGTGIMPRVCHPCLGKYALTGAGL